MHGRFRPCAGVDVADAVEGDVFSVVGVAADDGGAVGCFGCFDRVAFHVTTESVV